jgi:predicted Zn-dependent peptidase
VKRWLSLVALATAASLFAEVKLPPFTRQTLPNGVVLTMLPKKDVPLMTIRVLIRGGVESDPAGQGGLASITAELLRRGTAARSADRFSDELDFMGASYHAGVDAQTTSLSTEFLAKDAARAIDLLSDLLLHPVFPEAEVRKVLAQRADAAKALKDNPQAAAQQYYRAFFFGPQHPYGHPGDGDELSLARISRDAILGYHRRTYVGANTIVVAAGDLDPAALGPQLARAFAALPAGEPYPWKKDAPPARAGRPRLLLVDKPDATQTYFLIGQPGIHRTHPDRVVLWLVNTLFGGRFTSMLNEELRVNSGLTYGAGCQLERDRLTGSIAIATFTRTEKTAQAIDLALEVLKRLGEKGITAEQLASGKAYLKGGYPTERLETADQLAGVLGEMEIYGLGRGEVDDLFPQIDSITVEQANAAARKYYRPENLVFLLLGNAGKIRESARKYATEVKEVSITTPGL